MALPSSGTLSTTDLETEFAGVTPFTKTMDNFRLMVNSATKSTDIFFGKSAPNPLTPTLFSDVQGIPDVITVRGVMLPNGNNPCRWRLVAPDSISFSSNYQVGSWVEYTGTVATTDWVFSWYWGGEKYYRLEVQFGATYTHTKYSTTFTYSN